MCGVCCKEFRGWCRSFTRIEAALSALEGVLLVAAISFVIFLILHFMVCPDLPEPKLDTTDKPVRLSPTPAPPPTVPPDIECTWSPSEKTVPVTRYYISDATVNDTDDVETITTRYSDSELSVEDSIDITDTFAVNLGDTEYRNIFKHELDEEIIDDTYKRHILALVKLKPPSGLTFGCILTIITKHWTLTAASCIEAIEEVDTLDSFFMMEGYGEVKPGRSHALSDVQVHPLYRGANRSYDLAALRSGDGLIRDAGEALELPTMLDYFLVAIGERFVALGYGGFRIMDKSVAERGLRRVSVYSVGWAQCAGGAAEGRRAQRHLSPVGGAGCGAAPLCAGVLRSRGAPCTYCAGTPLVRGRTLYGVMSYNAHCGVSCEPQLYVNLARLTGWIHSILH